MTLIIRINIANLLPSKPKETSKQYSEKKKPFSGKSSQKVSKKHENKKNSGPIQDNSKPYQCYICEYKYSRSSHLTDHIISAHKDETDEMLYGCSFCDTRYDTGLDLKKHIRKIHDK